MSWGGEQYLLYMWSYSTGRLCSADGLMVDVEVYNHQVHSTPFHSVVTLGSTRLVLYLESRHDSVKEKTRCFAQITDANLLLDQLPNAEVFPRRHHNRTTWHT